MAGEKDKAKVDFEECLNRRRDVVNDKCREEIYKRIGVNLEVI